MLSSEAGRERPAEARLRWWLGGSGFPPALAPLGLLWNSLSAHCCHALGCEWHLTFGGGLLGAGRRPGHQAATLWGQLGTAGPGRNRAVPRPAGGWAGAFGYKGDPAATQGETWGFRGRGMVCLGWLLCWACPWSSLSPAPTAGKKLRPGKAGLATVALSHRLGCKPGEWGPGPGSPGQSRGFSFYRGSGPGSQTAPLLDLLNPLATSQSRQVPLPEPFITLIPARQALSAVELPGEPGGGAAHC